MEEVDSVLAHYGKKGMRWGIRKAATRGPSPLMVKTVPGKKVLSKGGERQPPHQDAIGVAAARQQAKASTTDSLSNVDLKAVVTRMNLEQQYATLIASSAGKSFARTLLTNTAKNEVTTLSRGQQGPIMKQLDRALAPTTGGKHRK